MAERAHPEFSTLLDGLTDSEKVEAAQDVAATIASPGWAVIVDLLGRRKARLLDELVNHVPVRTEAEYAARLAEARGFDVAVHASRSVLRVAEAAAVRLRERAS